ncbi:MAG TPA: hypothetical protein VGD77_17035 [Gemmatimonadaceae bacterium]
MTRRVVAVRDRALSARIVRTMPLHYAAGADAALDRPAHVRAGSGLAWVGPRLVVVQDDANFLALVDPLDGSVEAIALPAGAGGSRQFDDVRGNKAAKLDLEAVVSIPQPGGGATVLALGSGSTARRESVVALRGVGTDGAVDRAVAEVVPASAWYARLRALVAFAGSELNVEAAVYLGSAKGGDLRLFNRGNGAPRRGLTPVDATCDVSWPSLAAYLASPGTAPPPEPREIVHYDLGDIAGLALTFTDATPGPGSAGDARHRIVYTAAAEASPDATRDGPVAGCAVGVIDEQPEGISARWAPLEGDEGVLFGGKVEGIAMHRADRGRAYVVVDRDAPGEPAELCEVVLEGPWFTGP